VGTTFSILYQLGIYEGNYIENWIRELLAKKGKSQFKDLFYGGQDADDPRFQYKLRIITADVSNVEIFMQN